MRRPTAGICCGMDGECARGRRKQMTGGRRTGEEERKGGGISPPIRKVSRGAIQRKVRGNLGRSSPRKMPEKFSDVFARPDNYRRVEGR